MADMEHTRVIHMGPVRDRRVARAVDARRRLVGEEHRVSEATGGRSWVNGIELGATRDALAHLNEIYD